jgi:long-chain acyl-CoA synthetase
MAAAHLWDLIERAALVNAEADAIITARDVKSWRRSRDDTSALAGKLVGAGVKRGDRVSLLAANSPRYIETLFAIARIGAIAAPINTRLMLEEMAGQIRNAEPNLLLTDEAFAPQAKALQSQGAAPDLYALEREIDAIRLIDTVKDGALPPLGGASETVCLLYTGGTTGQPKGVMHSSDSLVMNVFQSSNILGDPLNMRFVHVAPMFHIGAIAYVVAVALHAGAHIPLPAFDPNAVLGAVSAHRATHVTLVPTMISRVLDSMAAANADLSSLRRIIYGASPIPEALLTRAIEALPHVEFGQSYGQTETITITVLPAERHVTAGPLAGKLKSAGAPAFGATVEVRTADGERAAPNALGEICVRSGSLMSGYWRNPEATAATLKDGFVHTGDIGFIDEDGMVTVVDRMKDMIIAGGENIYSVEVEDALFRHPAVHECAVIGIPHPEWGERVHAVVRLKPGAQATGEELIAFCRTRIAAYKAPRSVSFSTEPLPLSGAGKVLKRELRDALARQGIS